MRVAVHVDVAKRVVVLVEDVDLVRLLDDLKRIRHVGDARHAGEQALGVGIERRATRVVLLLLLECPGLIRNVIPFDHASAGRHAESRIVILNIPRGRVQDLPDSLQVGWPLRPRGGR